MTLRKFEEKSLRNISETQSTALLAFYRIIKIKLACIQDKFYTWFVHLCRCRPSHTYNLFPQTIRFVQKIFSMRCWTLQSSKCSASVFFFENNTSNVVLLKFLFQTMTNHYIVNKKYVSFLENGKIWNNVSMSLKLILYSAWVVL